ncbi:MAG: polysaccharide biosynthesis protein [Candidatus Omnitrophica bacterium]|nr:polysaccharide biosynthesis protein [Candidatus Omnitrophota bacterium]
MKLFKNKTLLITGGTGSFGKAMAHRLLKYGIKEIRIFSRDELKQQIMRDEFNHSKLKFYIGDTRDKSSVRSAMEGVDIVFHAAALKQVPTCEFFPMQAVLTNIVGTDNVIKSAIQNKVSKLVCLSTDKAVYPINSMGMTKALMEKITQAEARKLLNNKTIISCVRYGNVICSRGSVIPLFIKQIKANKPITITDPDMTRFMLSIDEAINLVFTAFGRALQGDILIKKAPACTILTLANALKSIFKSKVPIKIIGTRHGEKKHETLIGIEEFQRTEDVRTYFKVKMDARNLDYSRYFKKGFQKLPLTKAYTSKNTERLTLRQTEKLLLRLPEIKKSIKGSVYEM